MKKVKNNSTQITQIERINTDKISEDQPNRSNLRSMPKHWSWVKLGDVSKRIHYGYTASAECKNVGPKLLRITDIQEGKVNWNEVPYCEIPNDNIHKYLLSENDIVFARTGATVGKSFLIKGKIPNSVFASYLIRLQLAEKTLPKFIYLFFQSNNYWVQIKSSSAGIGQPNVNAQKLSNLSIPLPPLPEQKKIVEKIEELISGLDSGVASLKKAKEQLRLYRQSVLTYAFSGRLTGNVKGETKNGELPEGWKWVKLSEATQLNPKLPFEEIDEDILVSFLPMRQVEELTGKFDLSMEKKYSEVKKGFTPFTNGDVIFAKNHTLHGKW